MLGEVSRTRHGRLLLANDEQRDLKVALWVLDRSGAPDDDAFLAASRVAASLEHPHIVTLIGFHANDETAYQVLPGAELETLDMRLRKRRPDGEEIVRIVSQIADALEYAAERAVVHGDLTAEQVILIGRDAKVLGFGLRPSADASADVKALVELTRRMCAAGDEVRLNPALEALFARAEHPPAEGGFASPRELRAALRAMSPTLFEPVVTSRGSAFWKELSRRRVWQAAVWYAAAALGVVEGVDQIVEEAIGAPDWVSGYLARLALLGLPLAIVIAWTVERTPSGLRWTQPAAAPYDAHPRRERRGALAVYATSLIFTIGAAVALPSGPGSAERSVADGSSATTLDPRRIAVTEVSTIASADEADRLASFARFLHESLIAGLVPIEPLKVLSARGRAFVESAADSLARRLSVGTIVTPTLIDRGDSIRVMVGVIDGTSGEHVGSRYLDAPAEEIHSLVEPVVDSVLSMLRRELGETIERRLRVLETEVGAALEMVLFAEERVEAFEAVIRTRDLTQAEIMLMGADSLLAQAEELDPSWALPVVRRGRLRTHWQRIAVARGDPEPEQWLHRAGELADRALVKDPGNVDALELRGWVRMRLLVEDAPPDRSDRDDLFFAAEGDLLAALDGNPGKARVMRILSELLARRGDHEAAVVYAEDALESDPYLNANTLGPILFRLFEYNLQLGRDDEALGHCVDGGRRYPTPTEGYLFRDCLLQLMAFSDVLPLSADEAWSLRNGVLAGYPPGMSAFLTPRLDGLVALVLARSGLADSAEATMARAVAAQPEAGRVTDDLSLVLLASLGHWDEVARRLVASFDADQEAALRSARSRELRALREHARTSALLDSLIAGASEVPG